MGTATFACEGFLGRDGNRERRRSLFRIEGILRLNRSGLVVVALPILAAIYATCTL